MRPDSVRGGRTGPGQRSATRTRPSNGPELVRAARGDPSGQVAMGADQRAPGTAAAGTGTRTDAPTRSKLTSDQDLLARIRRGDRRGPSESPDVDQLERAVLERRLLRSQRPGAGGSRRARSRDRACCAATLRVAASAPSRSHGRPVGEPGARPVRPRASGVRALRSDPTTRSPGRPARPAGRRSRRAGSRRPPCRSPRRSRGTASRAGSAAIVAAALAIASRSARSPRPRRRGARRAGAGRGWRGRSVGQRSGPNARSRRRIAARNASAGQGWLEQLPVEDEVAVGRQRGGAARSARRTARRRVIRPGARVDDRPEAREQGRLSRAGRWS